MDNCDVTARQIFIGLKLELDLRYGAYTSDDFQREWSSDAVFGESLNMS